MIHKENMETDQVLVGKRIKIIDMKNQKEEIFKIVQKVEFTNSDPEAVSAHSPIGKALIGKRLNDIIEVNVPSGKIKYKVLDVS